MIILSPILILFIYLSLSISPTVEITASIQDIDIDTYNLITKNNPTLPPIDNFKFIYVNVLVNKPMFSSTTVDIQIDSLSELISANKELHEVSDGGLSSNLQTSQQILIYTETVTVSTLSQIIGDCEINIKYTPKKSFPYSNTYYLKDFLNS